MGILLHFLRHVPVHSSRSAAAVTALKWGPFAAQLSQQHRAMGAMEGQRTEGNSSNMSGAPKKEGATDNQQAGNGSSDGSAASKLGERVAHNKPHDLPPQYVKFMESGFLEAMRSLRERLWEDEWRSGGHAFAQERAIATFEQLVAEQGLLGGADDDTGCGHNMEGASSSGTEGCASGERATGAGAPASKGHTGKEGGEERRPRPRITYATITQLYQDPDNLDVVHDEALRARLRAIMVTTLDERRRDAYADATRRAEDMASLLKSGPGSVLDFVKKALPLPGFLK